jgi:hypothetical protein
MEVLLLLQVVVQETNTIQFSKAAQVVASSHLEAKKAVVVADNNHI